MRQIRAAFDEAGVFVYQAFRPDIVDAALAAGTFREGFRLDRMTWIKPSFGWMLYRSGHASKPDQERILRIHLSHDGFRTILSRAVPTVPVPELFADGDAWRKALDLSEVRYQWDPDRDLALRKLAHRAIQIGLSGQTVRQYVHQWILGLEDVTPLAHAIRAALDHHQPLPAVPAEPIYPVDAELARQLHLTA